MAGSSALITYNLFCNPQWFNYVKYCHHPMVLLALLTMYGTYTNDKAILGGVAGGYAAMTLAL